MDVSTHTQMENRLTEALFLNKPKSLCVKTSYSCRSIFRDSQKDRGVPASNKKQKEKSLSDFHSIFQQSVFGTGF